MSHKPAYLLDTHAILWWLTNDPKLSTRAFEIIQAPQNAILVSSASGGKSQPNMAWESYPMHGKRR